MIIQTPETEINLALPPYFDTTSIEVSQLSTLVGMMPSLCVHPLGLHVSVESVFQWLTTETQDSQYIESLVAPESGRAFSWVLSKTDDMTKPLALMNVDRYACDHGDDLYYGVSVNMVVVPGMHRGSGYGSLISRTLGLITLSDLYRIHSLYQHQDRTITPYFYARHAALEGMRCCMHAASSFQESIDVATDQLFRHAERLETDSLEIDIQEIR